LKTKPLARPVQSSYRCKWPWEDSEEDLISITDEAVATIMQQPGIFERKRRSQLRRCQLCIAVGGRTFEHLNW